MERPVYVQYGCGWSAPEAWLNFDSSPTLRFERLPLIGKLYTRNARRFPANVRYGDVVKGLPVADKSCDGIYASHVLEHLAFADFEKALTNTFRYLKPGGTFRLVVPDLMRVKLSEHGFRDIRLAFFGDAEDSRFRDVEIGERAVGALCMQCRK